MTIDELRALCVEWQARLRLRDWVVEVAFVRDHKLGAHRCAENEYMATLKHAKVSLADPADADDRWFLPIDPEESLVHELLHLHFAPFEAAEGSKEQEAQETAINLIADTLVALKRAGGRDDAGHA